jgi:hypothetical protein
VPATERVRRPRRDEQRVAVATEAGRRAVLEHPPAAGLDAVAQRLEQWLPRAAGVAQQLLLGLVALDLPAQRQLAPQPPGGDVVGAVAELAAQQRAPDLVVGLTAHRLDDPVARRAVLERSDLLGSALQPQHREPHAHAVDRVERPEAQQIQRRRERPLASLEEERHRRRAPLELVGHPELVVELGDVAVAREEVVVVALDAVAVADVERRRLAAEPGPALVDVADVALLGQPAAGDQPRDPGPDDPDSHAFLHFVSPP